MAFKDTLKNLNHLFDWTALEVTEPMPYRKEYSDVGNLLLGYQVTVKYRHHGVYEYIFPVDNKIGLMTPARAFNRALKFSQRLKQRIR